MFLRLLSDSTLLLGGFFLYRIFFLLFFRLDGYERLNEALMDIAFFLQ